jgi:hypothetical protein
LLIQPVGEFIHASLPGVRGQPTLDRLRPEGEKFISCEKPGLRRDFASIECTEAMRTERTRDNWVDRHQFSSEVG